MSAPSAERIDGYAAMGARQPLQPYSYTPKHLGPLDVEVDISHCGMCHTDLHLINDDLGMSVFPLVPGHEIVGTVSLVGSAVGHVRAGQRVGIGPLAAACFACEQCNTGNENLCPNAQLLPLAMPGGYARRVRVDARCAFPIPDAFPSEYAAPLLCAGVTVFAPLLRYATSASRVGVVGVGGLGHLALQYARAMGCHVTAFSSSVDKAAEARQFGAHDFVPTGGERALEERAGAYDLILCAASASLPWTQYLNALKAAGTLCVLGVPDDDVSFPAAPLIFGQKKVVGSLIGSRWETEKMLEFSARHGVRPEIERFPMSEANAALERLSGNQLRYRAVLLNDGWHTLEP